MLANKMVMHLYVLCARVEDGVLCELDVVETAIENRTLLGASRSMLQLAGLHNRFWQEAISTTCHLQNQSPHKVLGLNTPLLLWFGRKPNVGHLTIFGVIAYSHVTSKLRKKIDPHSIKCIMVGYGVPLPTSLASPSTSPMVLRAMLVDV